MRIIWLLLFLLLASRTEAQPAFLIFFDWDQATLTAQGHQTIHQAADAALHLHASVDVAGFTDTSGTAQYNQTLSWHRAQTVVAEHQHNGVPAACHPCSLVRPKLSSLTNSGRGARTAKPTGGDHSPCATTPTFATSATGLCARTDLPTDLPVVGVRLSRLVWIRFWLWSLARRTSLVNRLPEKEGMTLLFYLMSPRVVVLRGHRLGYPASPRTVRPG